MLKLFSLLICATFSYCAESQINFRNKDLKNEVDTFLHDLKKNNTEIISVIFETTKKEDSVFISMSNGHPDLKRIKACAKYKGIYFCLGGDFPTKEYFVVKNPEPVPPELKKAYEKRKKESTAVFYEPFTIYLTFYKCKLVESVVANGV